MIVMMILFSYFDYLTNLQLFRIIYDDNLFYDLFKIKFKNLSSLCDFIR